MIRYRDLLLRAFLAATAILVALPSRGIAAPWVDQPVQPGFPVTLQGEAVEYSSPVAGDLDRDGRNDIVVAGRDGWVYAVSGNGRLLWQRNLVLDIDAVARHPAGKATIASTPAIGDIDADGYAEVVVGVGIDTDIYGHNGGFVALTHDGRLYPGWPQLTMEVYANGFSDGVWSSPALGDLDGDGKLEIVAGSFDQRVYAWRFDGTPLPGWPRYVNDTVWASPALADLDKDGYLEIIIGNDAAGIKGGRLNAFRRDGSQLPGWPRDLDEAMFSSPAVGDINGDGWLEVVTGTGNYPFGTNPTRGLFAFDHNGNPLPGWPVHVDDFVMTSPSIGDINGDGRLEVVAGTQGGKVYAIRIDPGTNQPAVLPGWPVQTRNRFGSTAALGLVGLILANFDADPSPEVMVIQCGDVVVLDQDGAHLTYIPGAPSSQRPVMVVPYGPQNTPGVADIDDDGSMELIRAGGSDPNGGGRAYLMAWRIAAAPARAPFLWTLWRGGADHHASYVDSRLDATVAGHNIPQLMAPGAAYNVSITMRNTGAEPWTQARGIRLASVGSDPLAGALTVPLAPGESIAPGDSKTFSVRLVAPTREGFYTTRLRLDLAGSGNFGAVASADVKVGKEPALYVLAKEGGGDGNGVYPVGIAPPIAPPANFGNWWAARSLGFSAQRPGGYVMLDSYGSLHFSGQFEYLGARENPWDAGANYQEIILTNGRTGYYMLDRFSHLYPSTGAVTLDPPAPVLNEPIARSAALTPDNEGIYVLDGYGRIRRGGNARELLPATPTFGADNAKRIKVTANGTGYYVLDAYGNVYNGGNAPYLKPNYTIHEGADWARDFELTQDEKGYYLLDLEGRIHTGGTATAPRLNLPPTWPGQDVARDLAVLDSRAYEELPPGPDNLTFLMEQNQVRDVSVVWNPPGGTGSWTATKTYDWLSVKPSSGTGPVAVTISVNTNRLAQGQNEDQVLIRSGTSAEPLAIPVQLSVFERVRSTHLPLLSR